MTHEGFHGLRHGHRRGYALAHRSEVRRALVRELWKLREHPGLENTQLRAAIATAIMSDPRWMDQWDDTQVTAFAQSSAATAVNYSPDKCEDRIASGLLDPRALAACGAGWRPAGMRPPAAR